MRQSNQKDFLEILADRLLKDYDKELASICLVLPSRRSVIFFQQALSRLVSTPIFAPRLITISDFSKILSGFSSVDNLTLSMLLYDELRLYYEEKGFFFEEYRPEIRIEQCQKLLKDFNDVDNFLVPADKIFQNIHHLEELSSLDYLTEEQKKTILSFWDIVIRNKEKNSNIDDHFISFSAIIKDIYPRYLKRLQKNKIGYEGLIVRQAGSYDKGILQKKIIDLFPFCNKFLFAGLYSITPAEKKLFSSLIEALGKESVQFFWEGFSEEGSNNLFWNNDFVIPYRQKIISNQKELGGELIFPTKNDSLPQVEVIEVATKLAGRKIIPTLVESILNTDKDAIKELRTAIMLPDEKALPSLLSSLGSLDVPLNVTMGYPLSSTHIAIWFAEYIDFILMIKVDDKGEVTFSAELLDKLIRHPLSRYLFTEKQINKLKKIKVYSLPYFYIEEIYDILQEDSSSVIDLFFSNYLESKEFVSLLLHIVSLFAKEIRIALKNKDKNLFENNYQVTSKEILLAELEYLKQYEMTLTSLYNVLPIVAEEIDISSVAMILKSLISFVNVPFEGEPLEGLQIMGLLESRLLLFDYLIIPDANERQLPRVYRDDATFIPYSLRLGYGLPVYNSKEAIDTYYFYRLIEGAKKIYFVTGGMDDIEPSRYILQLKYLSNTSISYQNLKLPKVSFNTRSIEIAKSPKVMAELNKFLLPNPEKRFSPSSLNLYTSCPLRFYFQYIRGIKEFLKEDDLLTPIDLGDVVHQSMESLYSNSIGKWVTSKDIESLEKIVDKVVLQKYCDIVFRGRKKSSAVEGIHKIYCDVAVRYVHSILQHDKVYENIFYEASEQKISFKYSLSQDREVSIVGYIDRIDRIYRDGKLVRRIVDYKTGGDELSFKDWQEIFPLQKEQEEKIISHSKAVAQLMLYCSYMAQNDNAPNIKGFIEPSLYILRQMVQDPSLYESSLFLKENTSLKKEIQKYPNSEWQKTFEQRFSNLLEEIFDEKIPFRQTKDTYNSCRYCQFAEICRIG